MEILIQRHPLTGEYIVSWPDGGGVAVRTKSAVREAVREYKRGRGWNDRLDGRIQLCWE